MDTIMDTIHIEAGFGTYTVHVTWGLAVTVFMDGLFIGKGSWEGRTVEDWEGDDLDAYEKGLADEIDDRLTTAEPYWG